MNSPLGTLLDLVQKGRDAFARQAWSEAFGYLSAADRDGALAPEDLERLATAAHLVGRSAESEAAWVRAHNEAIGRDDVRLAARAAFWLAFGLLDYGERARAGAWIARARRLLDERGIECVERGYLLLPVALNTLMQGDVAGAYATFCEAAEVGERFRDANLIALARHSRGRVLIRAGRIPEGIRLLDEAMIAVEAGELAPPVVGEVYCSVIEGCLEVFDIRRAQEWTAALTRWCEAQQDLVPYRDQCLIRRAEVLQIHGRWSEALDAARRACERLLGPPVRAAAGAAFYRCAELHRLRGEFTEAEEGYRQASRYGRTPQPGLALLRLAQGQTEAAVSAIRLALEGAQAPRVRTSLLPACVDILLAARDVRAARAAAEELGRVAAELNAATLRAAAAEARGAVLLAEGDPRSAVLDLRAAWSVWQEIDAPYDAARTRLRLAAACRELGDSEAAALEVDAARWTLEHLGAKPELARLRAQPSGRSGAAARTLSAREVQVLRLVAAGRTNRAIAAELLISERTVERHVSNIFAKLDVSSRSAATAYAYQHEVL